LKRTTKKRTGPPTKRKASPTATANQEPSKAQAGRATKFTQEEGKMSSFQAYDGAGSESASRSFGSGGATRASGTKRALCIGIDKYPDPRDQLGGCVNDANKWSRWLSGQGFSVDVLKDGQATRSGIMDAIRDAIRSSQPGHVVAIQYSGHGTQLPDEDGGERDELDEALVPHDHRKSGYVLDDDIAELCNQIPSGVNVTFFMDCCHSGTITRLFAGPTETADDVRIRFLRPDEEMLAAHRKSRQRAASSRSARSPYRGRNEILMSACRSEQTAKERGGQGDFTRYALSVLGQGNSGLTNAEFIDRVLSTGVWQDQRPQLWSDPQFYNQPLLGARDRSGPVDQPPSGGAPSSSALTESLKDLELLVSKIRNQVGGADS